ncbi:hypothetical protein ACFC09_03705 [Streptomyces sp. NPDC056161]|uniref:hypothetical protein n=1 Tax=Streptomyces sp. NPDC056161 TaxID=3345732 RepID=UPI0035E18D2B
MEYKALSIYLNDHLAGATFGEDLAWRMAREHKSSATGGDFRHLAEDVSQDRLSLLALMQSLHVPPRRHKVYGGWAAEKISRLKPNGRFWRRSGLSNLIELETLRMGIQGKQQLWQALLPVAGGLNEARLHRLLDRATAQMKTVDALHGTAAQEVLAGRGG